MTVKSGSDFDSHYNGSTGSDGQTRDTAGGWNDRPSDTDSIKIRSSKDGNHELVGRGDASNREFDNNHIHYFNDSQTGERGASVKKDGESGPGDKYISENFFEAVTSFMGWD